MPKRATEVRERPLFDIISYGRGHITKLSPAEVQQVARTTGRVPEVMVKVLPKDANTLQAVSDHIDYIGRGGTLELESDDGHHLHGEDVAQALIEDWDLDLEAAHSDAPKLVHKIVFSMPPGTSPKGVYEAVRNFCREEFGLVHRYAHVLHTDDKHPHVHVLLKAVNEQGERLHIRKATLREWRARFAEHLRAQGIAANATERYVRGETRPRKIDGIHRAALRGDSTHMRRRAETAAAQISSGVSKHDPAKDGLLETRRLVERGWRAVSRMLARDGQQTLARDVDRFIAEMPPARTENEWHLLAMREHLRSHQIPEPRRTR